MCFVPILFKERIFYNNKNYANRPVSACKIKSDQSDYKRFIGKEVGFYL